MNRRNFLKSLAAACGAAVVCPGELLRGKPKPVEVLCKHEFRWFAAKNEDAPAHCTVLNYDKYHHYEYTCILCGFVKYVEFRFNPAQKTIIKEQRWKAYYNGGSFKSEAEYKEFLDKFRTAFKNTKFKLPLIIGAYDEKI